MSSDTASVGDAVWIFHHEHDEGTTLRAFTSYEDALTAAAAVARRYWHLIVGYTADVPNEGAVEMPAEPPHADERAVEWYFAAQRDEEFHTIEKVTVE